ncbi:hypothetical protein KKF55_06670 [Patescibacteria group bacterium]|nr:hypothetical protein [Patescibacteria group bacterium]
MMPEGEWIEEPVTFSGISAWILAFVTSLLIFFTQYVPIGKTLIEGISGLRFVWILPVLLLLAFMFFLMTFVICGGVFMAAFLCLFYALGYIEHFAARFMGGTGKLEDTIKGSLYCSGIIVLGCLALFLAPFVKKEVLTFGLFMVGYNIVYFCSVLYFYGLISIAAKKSENLPRHSALIVSLVPLLILMLIGILSNKLLIPAIKPFIT